MPESTNATETPAPNNQPLLTLGDLARETGVSQHRIKYALAAYDIRPVQRAGVLRLFSRDQLPHIKSCLRRIGGGREAGKLLGAAPRKGAM